MIRRLPHASSISSVNQASNPLRSQSRPGHRKTFFAVCIEMVLRGAALAGWLGRGRLGMLIGGRGGGALYAAGERQALVPMTPLQQRQAVTLEDRMLSRN